MTCFANLLIYFLSLYSSFFASNMNHYGQATSSGHNASLSPNSTDHTKTYHGLEINRLQ